MRNKRKLAFNEKGKYEDIANKLRTKAKLSSLQHEIAAISKRTGIASESRLSLIQPKRFTVKLNNSIKTQSLPRDTNFLNLKSPK